MIKNKEFHEEINEMFKSYLYTENVKILIKDIAANKILENINYKKILFDSSLNIYKASKDGFIPIDNPNFKAVVIKK